MGRWVDDSTSPRCFASRLTTAGSSGPPSTTVARRGRRRLRCSGPTARILGGHEDDPAGSALALRFLGAVHRIALEGRAERLARHYPSAGGKPEPDEVWDDFAATFTEHSDELEAAVDRPVQTNEPGRCAALIGGFLEVAHRCGPELRVFEVGSSAGLNLRWDRYRYEARGETWGPADSPVRLCSYNTQVLPRFDTELAWWNERVVIRIRSIR